jgi:hypothetical protein
LGWSLNARGFAQKVQLAAANWTFCNRNLLRIGGSVLSV